MTAVLIAVLAVAAVWRIGHHLRHAAITVERAIHPEPDQEQQ